MSNCPEICPELVKELVPECDLKLKFSLHYSGGAVVYSEGEPVVTPATARYFLNLCSDAVKLNIPCLNSTKRILLGLPLTYVEGCSIYSLVLPTINSSTLSSTVYTDNIEVSTADTNEVLPIGLQVANGYLFIEIHVEGKLTFADNDCNGECPASISLNFNTFNFELKKKFKTCNVTCKPVVWKYADTTNPIGGLD